MSYDQKCWDLADHFLEEEVPSLKQRELLAHKLAQQIKSIIESFIEDLRCAE